MGMHAGLGRHGERVRGRHLLRLDGRARRLLRHEPHPRCAQRVSSVCRRQPRIPTLVEDFDNICDYSTYKPDIK